MTQTAIDWQAALAQHDRWLRTVALARLREPQAVEEVMQEVALAAVRQAAPLARCRQGRPVAVSADGAAGAALSPQVRPAAAAGGPVCRAGRAAGARPLPAIDPLGWLLAEERRGLVRRALAGLRAAGCGDPVAEVHRKLELSPDRRPLGREPRRGRGPLAPGPRPTAAGVGGAGCWIGGEMMSDRQEDAMPRRRARCASTGSSMAS